jgi:AraC-like DNA-binding protein
VGTTFISDFQVRILLYAYPRLTLWSFDSLSDPYWRLYWNSRSGGWLHFRGTRSALDPSLITLVPPDTACACGLERPVDHLNIHFAIESRYAASNPGILQVTADSALLRTIDSLGARIRRGQSSRKLDLMAHRLVADALDAVSEDAWPEVTIDPRIRDAVSRIEGDPASRLPIAELASSAGMSEGGFIRLFTQHAGMPPRAYHLRSRIAESCRLLVQTDLSMDEIAEKCGFWDRNYFTRMFKRMNYTTPVAFRKQRRQG